MKILFLAPYPLQSAPSQRFRFEFFHKFMEEKGMAYDFQSFLSIKGWKVLYEKGRTIDKALAVAGGFLRRMSLLFYLQRYSHIFIHRELTPFGPPVFEWLIGRVFQKKIIYDFDDAIWMPDQVTENPAWKILKWRSKVGSVCKWSWKVTAGNEYLADYARVHCSRVICFPTVVDTEIHQPDPTKKVSDQEKLTIGWTGSHSTLFYLNDIIPILQKLEQRHDFNFLVIANKNPQLPLQNFWYIPWNKETEIEDLSNMDIGIMPLEDTEWAKGKCGFKLIQYLAIGIPAVASPVGVNVQIIRDGETGYLADTQEKWLSSLELLLSNHALRKEIGKQGRREMIHHYSVASQKERFLGLFQD